MFILGVKYDRTFLEKCDRVQAEYDRMQEPAYDRILGGDAENFSV